MKRFYLLAASALLLAGCVAQVGKHPVAPDLQTADVHVMEGYTATVVALGLNNPSFVSFRPADGALTICDSGNGQVVVIEGGKKTPAITGMKTEYWKTLDDGTKAFKLGPLAALWVSPQQIMVTDAGELDGEETVATWHISSEGPKNNSLKQRSNVVGPTTNNPSDKGEGNLSGMCLMSDGQTYFVCGQGFDGKSWVLRGNRETGKLATAFSADEHGIETNSPMQCVPWRGNLLVVYSGAGGKDDGLIVEWDLTTGKPAHKWALPGVIDPMGLAQVPGTDNRFVVTDNNWSLTGVNPGTLSLVTLDDDAEVRPELVAKGVYGPVHCAFGPDDRLYVACLGRKYDSNEGYVIAVNGLVK